MNQHQPATKTPSRIIRLPEVINRTGRSRSSIYQDVADGYFPAPIKLGRNARAIGWPESVIEDWIQERIEGAAV